MPDKDNYVMSPLADPVVSAIFADEESAGLAAGSLIRAIYEEEGEGRRFGKVIKVTPQRIHTLPGQRGCRIDIEVQSDENKYIVYEVQINEDPDIMQRDLFEASRIYTKTSAAGTTAAQMVRDMPEVTAVNILMYEIRKDNADVLQPFKVMYVKPPMHTVIPQFSGYNIQLPGLSKMKPDFTNRFYCWCYTLYTAHTEGKTVQEVIDMTAQLQEFKQRDSGFMQFCDQYNLVATDPRVRDDYHIWRLDQMRRAGEIKGGYLRGKEEGKEEERERLQGVIDAEIAAKDAALAEIAALRAELNYLKGSI